MDPVKNEKGEWVIPATRRPDGTWRKEKVLKEGYVPPDEVRAFETRASKEAALRAKKGVPGMPPPVEKPKPKPAEPKKKKEVEPAVPVAAMAEVCISGPAAKEEAPADKDPKKRLKALKKKLREVLELSVPSGYGAHRIGTSTLYHLTGCVSDTGLLLIESAQSNQYISTFRIYCAFRSNA
eukprot:gene15994-18266_t